MLFVFFFLVFPLFQTPEKSPQTTEEFAYSVEWYRWYADSEGVMGTALWCPAEFFQQPLLEKRKYSEEEERKIADLFQGFNIFAVALSETRQGKPNFVPPNSLSKRLILRDRSGKEFLPLGKKSIPVELRAFVSSLRPRLAAYLGPSGENMALVFFTGKDNKGKRILDPLLPNSFTLTIKNFPKEGSPPINFRWKLPLYSLIPDRECPNCHEKCKSIWKYCPWDGAKL